MKQRWGCGGGVGGVGWGGGGGRNKKQIQSQQAGPGIILESAPRNTILCLFSETK